MKVIFLDIDGVLNNDHTKERFEGYVFVSDDKILLLKEIVDKTKAKIVLSSTWRRGWYCKEHIEKPTSSHLQDIRLFDALVDKLKTFQIELLDYTEEFGRRGDEIDLWLKQWHGEPIESFVILDDMSGADLQPHSRYLIQTEFWDGLMPNHVEKAIKILNENCKDKD